MKTQVTLSPDEMKLLLGMVHENVAAARRNLQCCPENISGLRKWHQDLLQRYLKLLHKLGK
jgi:hypothetical protein